LKKYEPDSLFINNLKGSVKSVESETFEAQEKLDEIEKGSKIYPKQGLSLFFPTMIGHNSKFTFTKEGRVLTSKNKSRTILSADTEEYSTENSYDDLGNRTKQIYRGNDVTVVITFEIEEGRAIRAASHINEMSTSTSEFKYEGDLLKELEVKNQDGDVQYKETYTYEDHVMNAIFYDYTGKEAGRYSMDKRGRILNLREPNDFEVHYKPDYALPRELKTPELKETQEWIKGTFDEQGNYSTLTHKKVDGALEVLNFKYVYDSKGNWTQCLVYEDKELLFVTYRTYEYY